MVKKGLILVAVLAVLCCATLPTFAASVYVPSVERRDAPIVTVSDGSVTVDVNSYDNRAQIEDAAKKQAFEKAFNEIKNAKSLADLNTDLAAKAQAAGVSVEDLVIRDFFDITLYNQAGEAIDPSTPVKVTMKVEPTYDRFIALLCYVAGEWTIITVELGGTNNDTLEFEAQNLGAYAVVVRESSVTPNPDDKKDSPQTGDVAVIPMAVAAVLLLTGATVAVIKSRKHA